MISDPIDDVTKACEDAEANAAKLQIDFAVIMFAVDKNGYRVVPVVELGEHYFDTWNLLAIATPSGIVYLWSDVPGYERNK